MQAVKSKYANKDLVVAIYTVNRHAKTALDPTYLYELKRIAIEKMLKEGRAKKIGLHFSKRKTVQHNQAKPYIQASSQSPIGIGKQNSVVLVQCGDYQFHIPATKEDLKSLPHLGELSEVRNQKERLALSQAKRILAGYTNKKAPQNSSSQPSTYKTPHIDVYKSGFSFPTQSPISKRRR